jgi:hypothetical protein
MLMVSYQLDRIESSCSPHPGLQVIFISIEVQNSLDIGEMYTSLATKRSAISRAERRKIRRRGFGLDQFR